MRCPYCQNPLPTSDAPECPACRLTFPRTTALVGAAPRLSPIVADTTQTMGQADQARLKRRIQDLRQRFPQLAVQLVMHQFPQEHPFSMHVFWLFNIGAFASESRKGNDNHGILIVVDPLRGESAIIPGYGLEPYLKEEAMEQLLESGRPLWEKGQWTEGFLKVLGSLDKLLETLGEPVTPGKCGDEEF